MAHVGDKVKYVGKPVILSVIETIVGTELEILSVNFYKGESAGGVGMGEYYSVKSHDDDFNWTVYDFEVEEINPIKMEDYF